MRVRVDHDVCEANGICEQTAPEVFHLRDDDILQVLQPRVRAEHETTARAAVAGCPKVALAIIEDEADS